MSAEVYSLFPTPVIRVPASEQNYDSVQREIQAAIKTIKDTNDSTSLSYLYKAVQETSVSEKTYDFVEKYNCVNLKNRIYEAVNTYVDRIGWRGPRDFALRGSWINITEKNSLHSQHCHPGYMLSGVYYYRTSEQQGAISFNNPNPHMFFCGFPQGQLSPQTVDVVPDDGDILLFPSWLVHSTRKNQTDEERVSIAFNIDYVGNTDVAFGLIKESFRPYHKSEYSTRSIFSKKV